MQSQETKIWFSSHWILFAEMTLSNVTRADQTINAQVIELRRLEARKLTILFGFSPPMDSVRMILLRRLYVQALLY